MSKRYFKLLTEMPNYREGYTFTVEDGCDVQDASGGAWKYMDELLKAHISDDTSIDTTAYFKEIENPDVKLVKALEAVKEYIRTPVEAIKDGKPYPSKDYEADNYIKLADEARIAYHWANHTELQS